MHDQLQTLENDALRGFLGSTARRGAWSSTPPTATMPDYPLKEWDLITKIGDHEVDNVGMVRIKDGLRLRFQYLVQKLAEDGKVPLTIVREGETVADRTARETNATRADRVAPGPLSVLLHLRPAGLLAGDVGVPRGLDAGRLSGPER